MRTYVAGHRGMVGSAILRQLEARGAETIVRSRAELELLDRSAVRSFMEAEKPDAIILAAAKVGGIHANDSYPAEFIYENLMIECNVVHSAFEAGVRKLLFLGSSCIYPRDAAQPLVEEALLTGPLEPTNEPYAIAKIAGIKLCESYNRQHGTDYRCVMPANLYGPNDSFYSENSHVLPALMARFHEAVRDGAEEVVIWGSGRPGVSSCTSTTWRMPVCSSWTAGIDLSGKYPAHAESRQCRFRGRCLRSPSLLGSLAKVTGFSGRISYDRSRPDGTPRKLLDVSRLAAMGWRSKIALEQGIGGPTSGSSKTWARRAASQCPNLSSPAATGFPRWALPCSRSGAARRRLMCGERGQRSRVLHRFHRSKVSSDSMRVA